MPRTYYRKKKKYARRSYRTYKRRSYGRRWRYRGRSFAWGNRTARKVGALYKAVKMRAVYRPSRYVAVKRRYSSRRAPYGKAFTGLCDSRQKAIVSREAKRSLKRAGVHPAVAEAAVDAAAAATDVDMKDTSGYSIGGLTEALRGETSAFNRFTSKYSGRDSPLLRFDEV